jgi:triphosphoribosyl-dephospho-CoA synthase
MSHGREREQDSSHGFAAHVARLALRSLHSELTLFPKPGLVSLVDSGSHADMDANTFMRSLFSLRHYFRAITRAGAEDQGFATLRQLGLVAEQRMLAATAGINTHRGAIFALGLLCAALGRMQAGGMRLCAVSLRDCLRQRWGQDLALHQQQIQMAVQAGSHGATVWQRYATGGARQQAADGLPLVFELALPHLRQRLQQGCSWQGASVETLFALMAQISDSNVLYRAGWPGMHLMRQQAQAFLQQGGALDPAWPQRALACHRLFVAQGISPGGAADMLAATCLLHFALP